MIGRNIFYIILSCAVIFACGLAKNFIDEAKANKKAQIEKRNRLSLFYKLQFETSYSMYYDNRIEYATYLRDSIAEIEKNMRADGYDWLEINEIRGNANGDVWVHHDERVKEKLKQEKEKITNSIDSLSSTLSPSRPARPASPYSPLSKN